MIQLPDTRLVKDAEALVTPVLSAPLLAHSQRAWALASAYGEKKGVRHDGEGLYLAALFHDLGLCPPHRDRSRPFVEQSSGELRKFCQKHSVDPSRSAVLEEAIELHFRPWPSWGGGAEVGLLQVGAWMDVVGLRWWNVERATRREVVRLWPRGGFTLDFNRRFLASLGSVPACVGLMWPGFGRRRPATRPPSG